jgi:hypothetical protein
VDKKRFSLEALQPLHQPSLPAGHFTNVSQARSGEPTSFNWCSQPSEKVKAKRKVKARSPVKTFLGKVFDRKASKDFKPLSSS